MAARKEDKDRYHHGNLRTALLSAAVEVLKEVGEQNLSLREVARRAGVSHAAPYAHFACKLELLQALVGNAFLELDAAMEEAQRMAARDPLSQLFAAGLGYVNFGIRNPDVFGLMWRSDLCPPNIGAQREQTAAYGSDDGAFGRLLRAIAAVPGTPPRDDPRFMTDALLCWTTVHGLVHLEISGALKPGGQHPVDVARLLLERLQDLYPAAKKGR